jgi:polyferredoxin
MAFSLTTGPYFCGWICPTGTFQEWAAAGRMTLSTLIFRGNPPRPRVQTRLFGLLFVLLFFIGFIAQVLWLGSTKRFYVEDSSLYWAASLILLVFLVLASFVDDRAIRALRVLSFVIILVSALLKSMIVSPVHFAFADVNDPASMLTTLVLVVASLFVSRAWCRYVCPWGFVMGCIHRISRLGIRSDARCTRCGTCNRLCKVEAVDQGTVRRAECQFCLVCVDKCPQSALEVVDEWHRRD